MEFHIVIPHSQRNILLFRKPTINHLNCCWQTSKRFSLAAHFLSITNTQAHSDTEGAEITGCRAPLCVSVIGAHRSSMKLAVD